MYADTYAVVVVVVVVAETGGRCQTNDGFNGYYTAFERTTLRCIYWVTGTAAVAHKTEAHRSNYHCNHSTYTHINANVVLESLCDLCIVTFVG